MIIKIEINCEDFETAEYFLDYIQEMWKAKIEEPVENNRVIKADLQRPFGHIESVVNGELDHVWASTKYPTIVILK